MKRIGIKQIPLTGKTNLKKDFLFFDKLIIDKINYEFYESAWAFQNISSLRLLDSEINYLIKRGVLEINTFQDAFNDRDIQNRIISDPNFEKIDKELKPVISLANQIKERALQKMRTFDPKLRNQVFSDLDKHQAIVNRIHSIYTSILYKDEIRIPVITDFSDIPSSNKKEQIINIVIKQIPALRDDLSWEEVLEFKSDKEAYSKFLAINNWITEISHSQFTENEICEKMEYLLSEYETHMNIHKTKFNHSTLEIVTVTSLEILENLVKLKLSKLAKQLFELKNHEIKLLEAEKSAPGNQLAYLHTIQSRFGK